MCILVLGTLKAGVFLNCHARRVCKTTNGIEKKDYHGYGSASDNTWFKRLRVLQ